MRTENLTLKIHYYIDWFQDTMPERMAELLRNDISDRKSLVMISAYPSDYEKSGEIFNTIIKVKWLDPAGIIFDEYSLIDYRTAKEEAQKLLKNASVIFLLGGNAVMQSALLTDYELPAAIKESNASVIIGVSAGSKNMSAYWVRGGKVYGGLGLDNFAREVHYKPSDTETVPLDNELFALSRMIEVYVSCYESVIRSENGKLEFLGEVYLISDSKLQKLDETL